mgnify:CR=1 FL=1
MKRILIILSIFITATLASYAGESRPWEDASHPNESREQIRDGIDGEEMEITVRDGWVYVTTQKPVTVKIFTILGQLITSETIRPGTKRIHISSRGIYILRAGTVTRRITI